MRGFVAGLVIGLLLTIMVASAQVTVIEESRVSVWITQSNVTGQWHVYCLDGCDNLLKRADVADIYRGFGSYDEANAWRLSLTR